MLTCPVFSLVCFGFSIFFAGCYVGLSIGRHITNEAFEEIHKILDNHKERVCPKPSESVSNAIGAEKLIF